MAAAAVAAVAVDNDTSNNTSNNDNDNNNTSNGHIVTDTDNNNTTNNDNNMTTNEAPTAQDEEDFIALLKELSFESEEPAFHSKSKWIDICKLDKFINDARFKKFDCTKYENIAQDQFERFCWSLTDELEQPKKKLKQFLKQQNYNISPTDTVSQLTKMFKESLDNIQICELPKLRLLFAEMIAKQQYLSNKRQNMTNDTVDNNHIYEDAESDYERKQDRRRRDKHNSSNDRDNPRVKLSSFDNERKRKDYRDRDKHDRYHSKRDKRDKDKASTNSSSTKSYPTLPPPFPPPQAYLEMMHRHHENLKRHIEHDRFKANRIGYNQRSRSRSRDRRDRRQRGRGYYHNRDRRDRRDNNRRNNGYDNRRDRRDNYRERERVRNHRDNGRTIDRERDNRRDRGYNNTMKTDFDVVEN